MKITGNQPTQAEYFYDALVSKFPGLGTRIFQFALTPFAASWADGTAESAYGAASVTSSEVGGFFMSGSNFYNAYRDLVNSLKVTNPNKDPNYLTIQTELKNQTAAYNVLLQKAQSAYSNYKALNTDSKGNALDFTTWSTSVFGANYGSQLQQQNTLIAGLTSRLGQILTDLDAPHAAAVASLKDDQITITPANGTAMKVPRFSISGNLTQDKSRWDLATSPELDVTLKSTGTVKTPWKVLYHQQIDQHCFNTSTDNTINTTRIITDSQYSLNLQAIGLESYNIQRGTWYDPSFVNPSVALEPGGSETNASLFGPKGPLHLVPEVFVVMYKPKMTLTVTTETYEQYIEGKAGVSVNWLDIFGLRFDAGEASGIKVVKGATTTTVNMPIPGGSVPQVIGVASKNTFLKPAS